MLLATSSGNVVAEVLLCQKEKWWAADDAGKEEEEGVLSLLREGSQWRNCASSYHTLVENDVNVQYTIVNQPSLQLLNQSCEKISNYYQFWRTIVFLLLLFNMKNIKLRGNRYFTLFYSSNCIMPSVTCIVRFHTWVWGRRNFLLFKRVNCCVSQFNWLTSRVCQKTSWGSSSLRDDDLSQWRVNGEKVKHLDFFEEETKVTKSRMSQRNISKECFKGGTSFYNIKR